jgi:glutathione S-transferase
MITLYEFALSGNCHKIRLMLSLLGLEYTSILVDGSQKQQRSANFLAKNPFGQVPVLSDNEAVIRDSQAILVYLARKYGNTNWLPEDAAALADVIAWLSTAAHEVALGPNRLRLNQKFGRDINVDECRKITLNLLTILQQQLEKRTWLASEQATIADIAIYPYIALAPEGGIDLSPYPAVTTWLSRIQALPRYVGMPGMWKSE